MAWPALLGSTAVAGALSRFGPKLATWGSRAVSGLRTSLFGTPARAATTGFFGGTEVAGLIPEPLKNATPGGAQTIIIAGLVGVAALIAPEVLDDGS